MNIQFSERGKYLRGLFVVARMDNSISATDRILLKNTAKYLGYSNDFYEEIVKTVMQNEFIPNDPVKFNSTALARYFISDALKLASADADICCEVVEWLKSTALLNSIGDSWVQKEIEKCCSKPAAHKQYMSLSVSQFT